MPEWDSGAHRALLEPRAADPALRRCERARALLRNVSAQQLARPEAARRFGTGSSPAPNRLGHRLAFVRVSLNGGLRARSQSGLSTFPARPLLLDRARLGRFGW